MLIVLTTVPASEGGVLAHKIVGSSLAACVQIVPQIRSVYRWQGEVEDEAEDLLLIKTTDERYDALAAFITENHSYDVPEITALDAAKVSESYLAWAVAQTQL